MSNTVTNADLDRMRTFGRLVACTDNKQALESAAEYLAVARLEGDNSSRLWFWFNEGARDYVDDMQHLEEIQDRLESRIGDLVVYVH